MRVLGVDPGLRNMGWGIIDVAGSKVSHVANGVCHSKGDDLALRLLSLYEQLRAVMLAWVRTVDGEVPAEVVIEGVTARRVALPFYDPEGVRARG